MAVGSWLIAKEHSLATVCSTTAATGVGLGAQCMNAVSSYFIGFALIAGGLVILMLAVFLMSKREDQRRWRKEKAAVIKLRHEEADKLRKAA
jgi:ABC-type proline/glycine betaine transport system permease subunit